MKKSYSFHIKGFKKASLYLVIEEASSHDDSTMTDSVTEDGMRA